MLAEVHIVNFGLIDDLRFGFGPGLNVLTGETGAGKSLVVQAVKALTGSRTDGSRVGQAGDAAEIEGFFALPDGREFVLRRVLGSDGKSRCFIDGRLATLSQLSEIAEGLVDISGQHQHQSLLKPEAHLALLDKFGGAMLAAIKAGYRRALDDYRARHRRLLEMEEAQGNLVTRRRTLAWTVKELKQAELAADEDDELERKVDRLKSHAELFEAAVKAKQSLDDRVIDGVQQAKIDLERIAPKDGAVREATELLGTACANLEETASFLRNYCEGLALDYERLDAYQQRLFFLNDLKKKYGVSVKGLLERLESAEKELSELEDGQAAISRLSAEVADSRSALDKVAGRLSGARAEAAENFAAKVRGEFAELALEKALFTVDLVSKQAGAFSDEGLERAEFMFSANAGQPARPLAKVASGGELARVMLAVRTVLGQAGGTHVLIFDEIDAGIGGKTAVKVGERLALLAADRQVISVTHLAQTAAFGNQHFAVAKVENGSRTSVVARQISGAERLAELSRLGGTLDESSISFDHAKQLLKQAQGKGLAVAPGD